MLKLLVVTAGVIAGTSVAGGAGWVIGAGLRAPANSLTGVAVSFLTVLLALVLPVAGGGFAARLLNKSRTVDPDYHDRPGVAPMRTGLAFVAGVIVGAVVGAGFFAAVASGWQLAGDGQPDGRRSNLMIFFTFAAPAVGGCFAVHLVNKTRRYTPVHADYDDRPPTDPV